MGCAQACARARLSSCPIELIFWKTPCQRRLAKEPRKTEARVLLVAGTKYKQGEQIPTCAAGIGLAHATWNCEAQCFKPASSFKVWRNEMRGLDDVFEALQPRLAKPHCPHNSPKNNTPKPIMTRTDRKTALHPQLPCQIWFQDLPIGTHVQPVREAKGP